jgi:ribosome-associated protein
MQRLNALAQVIFDKKGFNILVLDVRQVSNMAEFVIIAEGSVSRHLQSLAGAIKEKMGVLSVPMLGAEGERGGEWIIMDYYNIVIHLFTPEMREHYALEELWKKGSIVDVEIIVEIK